MLLGLVPRDPGGSKVEGAVLRPQETVLRAARVIVISRNLTRRIDACRARSRRAGGINGDDGAIGRAQEAVLRAVTAISRDRSLRVDAFGVGEGRTRTIETCDGAVFESARSRGNYSLQSNIPSSLQPG